MNKNKPLSLVTDTPPASQKRTVSRTGKTNGALRSREHLTPQEIEALIKAARKNRHGGRDSALIMVAFHHGLRVSELVNLRWEQIDFEGGALHVRRAKQGMPATHPLPGRELRALRQLRRDAAGPFVFVSERGAPLTPAAVNRMLQRLGERQGFPFPLHAHMLRHACGYKLANQGTDTRTIQGYLGHRNIRHTVRYTELAPTRFRGLFE